MSDASRILEQWFPQDDRLLQPLRGQVHQTVLSENQLVFQRGDTCLNFVVVISGCMRVQTLSSGGRAVILYRVSEEQSCVITTSCLISGEVYPADGVADEDTEILLIPLLAFS
ncbi:hypothetical protein MNBD_GAMMA15-345, partial [hydrothermal vent metagenome]